MNIRNSTKLGFIEFMREKMTVALKRKNLPEIKNIIEYRNLGYTYFNYKEILMFARNIDKNLVENKIVSILRKMETYDIN